MISCMFCMHRSHCCCLLWWRWCFLHCLFIFVRLFHLWRECYGCIDGPHRRSFGNGNEWWLWWSWSPESCRKYPMQVAVSADFSIFRPTSPELCTQKMQTQQQQMLFLPSAIIHVVRLSSIALLEFDCFIVHVWRVICISIIADIDVRT